MSLKNDNDNSFFGNFCFGRISSCLDRRCKRIVQKIKIFQIIRFPSDDAFRSHIGLLAHPRRHVSHVHVSRYVCCHYCRHARFLSDCLKKLSVKIPMCFIVTWKSVISFK